MLQNYEGASNINVKKPTAVNVLEHAEAAGASGRDADPQVYYPAHGEHFMPGT